MARKQTTASQRQLLERTLSDLAALITDMAPQAQVEMTFEQYEDEDAHIYVHPHQAMTAEEIEHLELTVGERCNEILFDTGLFIAARCLDNGGGKSQVPYQQSAVQAFAKVRHDEGDSWRRC